MPTLVSADEFTVGWVCALPIELAAAAEMMDEEFADLPLAQPTPTSTPWAESAPTTSSRPAAIVASQMKSSFPSLRFNILVGIGGGAPDLEDGNDVDIRLGDVVISQPAGQHGGVVQYDFGKTGAGGVLARVGSLNASPEILLKALAKLRSNDFRGKTRITEHLAKYTDNPKFRSPGPEKDTLYMAASTHVPGPTCLKCRRDEVILREARESTDPVLFFGTIASGNQVIKDGKTRKRHSQELGGVLCFEMEAAGLMNNFPCIVVRGICDYADAHKNKKWQPYAAATAAAYAKELLLIVPSLESVAGDWQRSSSGGPLALEPAQRPMTEHQGATFNGPITGRNVLAGTRMSGNNNLTLS